MRCSGGAATDSTPSAISCERNVCMHPTISVRDGSHQVKLAPPIGLGRGDGVFAAVGGRFERVAARVTSRGK